MCASVQAGTPIGGGEMPRTRRFAREQGFGERTTFVGLERLDALLHELHVGVVCRRELAQPRLDLRRRRAAGHHPDLDAHPRPIGHDVQLAAALDPQRARQVPSEHRMFDPA